MGCKPRQRPRVIPPAPSDRHCEEVIHAVILFDLATPEQLRDLMSDARDELVKRGEIPF